MEKKSGLRYVAGVVYVVYAILNIIELVQNGFWIWTFLSVVGAVLVAAGLFIALPVLSAIGSGVCGIGPVRMLIVYLSFSVDSWFPKRYIFIAFLFVAFWILLVIACLKTENAKQLGIVAGVVAIVRLLAIFIMDGLYQFTFMGVLWQVIIIVGAILLGFAYTGVQNKNITALSANTAQRTKSVASVENQIERLINLKSLLDSGVITQEEFDAKKKQILEL